MYVPITKYPWGGIFCPEAFAEAKLTGSGLKFRLWCCEKHPRVTMTKPNSLVCLDSCLEVFLNPYPDFTRDYLNFEMNAAGTLLLQKAPTAPTAALSTWQCRITRRYMPGSCRICGAWSWKYLLHFCSRYTAPQPPLCRKTLWAIFTSVPARRRNVTPVGLLPIPLTLISTARTRSGRYRSAGKENMGNSC